MAKKIVITGATGFLGRSILKKCIKENLQTFVLIRNTSKIEYIEKYKHLCTFVYYNTLRDEHLPNLLELAFEADCFIHCAWQGVDSLQREQAYQITSNVSLTIDAANLAYKIRSKKWIGIGSQAEYGLVNNSSNEFTTPINPVSIYGKSKVSCFWAASGLCQIYGIEMLWCRVFSLYGPHDNPNYLIPYLIKSLTDKKRPLLTLCEQKWDYLHVTDAADAIMMLSLSFEIGVFNIGSGLAIELKKVIERIKQEIYPSMDLIYGDKPYSQNQIMHLEANIEKLKKAIHWSPKINIEEGLISTIYSYNTKISPYESI